MNEPMNGVQPDPRRDPDAGRPDDVATVEETVTTAETVATAEDAPEAEAGPLPLGVARTPTGNAEVDALLERLGDADDLPVEGHVEVYEDVHRGLRDALTALDARPGPPPPTTPYDARTNRS